MSIAIPKEQAFCAALIRPGLVVTGDCASNSRSKEALSQLRKAGFRGEKLWLSLRRNLLWATAPCCRDNPTMATSASNIKVNFILSFGYGFEVSKLFLIFCRAVFMHLNILTFFSISVETQAFRHTQVVIGGPIITHNNNNNTRRRRELTIFFRYVRYYRHRARVFFLILWVGTPFLNFPPPL